MSYIKTALALFLLHITCILAQCPAANLIKPCTCSIVISGDPVVECRKITDMDILRHAIESTGDRTFHGLYLTDSAISYLPAEEVFLKQFQSLKIVNSAMISLFETEPAAKNNLTVVELDNIRLLRGVDWGLFKNFKNLLGLSVENIAIRSLGKKFVENISPNLQALYLTNVQLKKIYPNAFTKLDKFKVLFIRNCFVRKLQRSMFATPSELVKLDLSGNLIESLPAGIFSDMPTLESVNLDNNKISIISETVFKNTNTVLRELLLSDNPIECECSMKWLLKRENKDHMMVVGNCDTPEEKKGVRILDLKEADFEYCKNNGTYV